jgi:hypothetical protein
LALGSFYVAPVQQVGFEVGQVDRWGGHQANPVQLITGINLASLARPVADLGVVAILLGSHAQQFKPSQETEKPKLLDPVGQCVVGSDGPALGNEGVQRLVGYRSPQFLGCALGLVEWPQSTDQVRSAA